MHAFLKTGKLAAGGGPSSAKSDVVTKKAPKPWVEKYRPRKVSDVVQQEDVVAVLARSMQRADLPNLLFYGPPGTGKTSTILAAARELYGSDLYASRVLELNASDERGIQVIREKVKTFAQNSVSSTRPDGRACPPFKLIVLDEADSMTHAAQAALRRTMEKQSRSTRFCLICNYVSRIIEPLTSRCSKFRFRPLGAEQVSERLRHICSEEAVKVSPEALEAVMSISEGDLRRAITTLQSCARLAGETELQKDTVEEVTGVVPAEWLQKAWAVCGGGSVAQVAALTDDMAAQGFSGAQLLLQLHDTVLEDASLSDAQRAIVMERIAEVDHKLLQGADEQLQLLDLFVCLMQQLSRPAAN